jgi:hypothetical protein
MSEIKKCNQREILGQPFNHDDNEYYAIACEFMARTELYDRTLTHHRSIYDPTATLLDNPFLVHISNEYARKLKNYFLEYTGGTWEPIKDEILRHKNYTTQMWIDEWERIENGRL